MMRLAVIGLALMAGACTIDGPEPGSTSVIAELERQQDREAADAERLRRCQMGETGVERDDRRCRDGVPR